MPTILNLNFLRKYWVLGVIALMIILRLVSCQGKPKSEDNWQVLRTVKVQKSTIALDISTTGEVRPQNRLEVKPPIAGRIEEIYVKEGDVVKKGDLLAQMSSTERAALLDSAHMKSPEDFKYWQEAYRPTPLMAPIEGTVIVRDAEAGQTVETGDVLIVISDRLIVDALVNETDIGKVLVGQTARIILDAYPEQIFSGTVDHIAYEAELDKNVNIYHVDIVPAVLDPVFRSGMTAQVNIRAGERENVLTVPEEAVQTCPEGKERPSLVRCVARGLSRGKPKWQEVSVGLSNGVNVELVSGVSENDSVAVLRRVEKSAAREKRRLLSPFSGRSRR